MPAQPAVDPSSLLALRQLRRPGAPDPVDRIVRRFLEETTARLAVLRRAAEQGDAEALASAAHALKGVAGTVGANELQALARQIEQRARDGDPVGAAQAVAALEAAFARARPIFEELIDVA